MKRIVLLVLAALAGCQTVPLDPVYATARPPTPALRSYLAEQARTFLADPYSVRDVAVSSVTTLIPKANTTLVCVRGNAKNRMGGYVGMTVYAIRMTGDTATGSFENDPFCGDPRLTWYPFPELKNLKDQF